LDLEKNWLEIGWQVQAKPQKLFTKGKVTILNLIYQGEIIKWSRDVKYV